MKLWTYNLEERREERKEERTIALPSHMSIEQCIE